jgi:predicted regulator of Ras-like GTPase activity (Roadblock/LC7/MglB family)
MSENKISEALEHLRQSLPEKPDWIVLSSVDGLLMGAVNVDIYHEERNPSWAMIAQLSIAERASSEFNLGLFEFSIVSAGKGFLVIIPIHDDFLLGMKYNKQFSISDLGNMGNNFSALLEELSFKLKDR